ncbi:MAG: diaminopimelate decarboxylase [Alphaproteobacteria bacterium]|nr:diaminopimelate decarboxylase [Alphaproteobacteria bacterium]
MAAGAHGFSYRSGVLAAEEVPLAEIAAAVATPLYCYATAGLLGQYQALRDAFAGRAVQICYALKANDNLAVVRTFAAAGAGADIVSVGELHRALAAGVPPGRIVFSGVGKTTAEMATALAAGIHQFNVESLPELETLAAVAGAAGTRAPVVIRINPDVDAGTHDKIATGRKQDKFGVDWTAAPAIFARAAALASIDLVGIAVHIGSQLTSLAPYTAAFGRVAEMVRTLRGQGIRIDRLDLGGGLGVRYSDETPLAPAAYARLIAATVGELGCALTIEPGRFLVANSGVLLTRVILVKESAGRRFVIVDAGMNDLIRPALYGAHHTILPVVAPRQDAVWTPADVVGPVCESGDIFARDRPLPPVAADDLLVLLSAGAYSSVMASRYNSRPPAPDVQVHGRAFAVTRRRLSHAEMLAAETLPPWLGPESRP